jgi:isoquinoline 1-oxidoreductase
MDCGGGFGSKQRGEVFLEAARMARGAGKPVRLVWSREEETTISYSRPAGVLDVKSGFDEKGRLLAWEFHNYNSGASGLPTPYDVQASWCGFHAAPAPLRQGSYRSLAAAGNTFARESHMEEIASQLDLDPVEFRLRNVADARLREVIEKAASLGNWSARKGRAIGLAANLEKDARLALCVEAEVDPTARTAKLVRAVMVFDPGAALNPDHLKNQIEGAIMQGLGGALFEEIRWEGARFTSRRLSSYRVPRFSDAPKIEVHLIDRREIAPAGCGESPITVVAPAIASAIFNATGKRLRSLPLLRAWRELPA